MSTVPNIAPVHRTPISRLLPFQSWQKLNLSFEKAFDINCRLLARDRDVEEVDLSFAGCQCPPAVKANREWRQELLNPKPVCMVEAILLAATIFWDPNFLLCPGHTLNLAKKTRAEDEKSESRHSKRADRANLSHFMARPIWMYGPCQPEIVRVHLSQHTTI